MAAQLPGATISSGTFLWTYVQSSGRWNGCDWPTTFGEDELDLNGLRASQLALLAGATSRCEAPDWLAAAAWLKRVEQDAKEAEGKAAKASELAERGSFVEALRLAEEACAIEGRYHSCLVWQPLRDAIAAALATEEPEPRT